MSGTRISVSIATAALAASIASTPARAVISDSLELTNANGAVLTNSQCPLVAGARNCSGELQEGPFPNEANGGFLKFRVAAPAAGQTYRAAVLTLTEPDNANIVSDKIRLIPRRIAGGGFDLYVAIAAGSDLVKTNPNIPEEPNFQDLTAQLFANSTAGIQANPPFRVMFNSDCADPGQNAGVRPWWGFYTSRNFRQPFDACFLAPPLPELPPLPEPATLAILGAGLAGLWRVTRARPAA